MIEAPTVQFNGIRWSHWYGDAGNIGLEIGQCNLECMKCWSACGAAPYRHLLPRLTAGEIVARLHEYRERNKKAAACWLLRFTGGEWLLSNDSAAVLFEIARLANPHGFWILVETNCTNITPEKLRGLAEIRERGQFFPTCGIFASIKGIDHLTFCEHTRRNGILFERSLRGLYDLDSLGVYSEVCLNCTAVTEGQAQPFMRELQENLTNFKVIWKPVKPYRWTGSTEFDAARTERTSINRYIATNPTADGLKIERTEQ